MDYYLIKGEFHVVGYSPDGDSLKFEADNPKHWDKIASAHREEFLNTFEKDNGVVQLRLQGVDALETHYSPSRLNPPSDAPKIELPQTIKPKIETFRQPAKYGQIATDYLLELLGVEPGSIKWWGKIVSQVAITKRGKPVVYRKKNTDPLEGFVVVNDFDRKGRPIAWVFAGKISHRSGSRLTTSKLKGIMEQSGNYQLISQGLVYPYFFYTLEADLRDSLMAATQQAQEEKLNIWSEDETLKGITTRKFSEITEDHLILPYLFRRLVKHQYKSMMDDYWEALKKRKSYKPKTESLYLNSFFNDTNPYVFLIKEREFQRLDEIIKVTKTKIRMNTHPGNIVFLS